MYYCEISQFYLHDGRLSYLKVLKQLGYCTIDLSSDKQNGFSRVNAYRPNAIWRIFIQLYYMPVWYKNRREKKKFFDTNNSKIEFLQICRFDLTATTWISKYTNNPMCQMCASREVCQKRVKYWKSSILLTESFLISLNKYQMHSDLRKNIPITPNLSIFW